MKVFLDTNVLASGLATRGLCTEVVEAVLNEHELLICDQVLQELVPVLASKFRLPATIVKEFAALLRAEATVVPVSKTHPIRVKDKDDIVILSCAISGEAEVFITGDKELLALKSIGKLSILSPREFWQEIAGLRGSKKS